MLKKLFSKEMCLVYFISLTVSLISSSRFLSQFLNTPKDHVLIGVSHYFEDFYYYLDQFYQGAHGRWLTHNNFTSEVSKPSLLYFNHLLLGKIGGLLGMESFTSYNISLLFLKFIFLILCYQVLKILFPDNVKYRLTSFMIFSFSTSFPIIEFTDEGIINHGPLLIYRAKNTFFSRFGNIPKNYVENIIYLILLIQSFVYFKSPISERKGLDKIQIFRYFMIILLTFWLSLSEAVKAAKFFIIYIIIFFLFRKKGGRHFGIKNFTFVIIPVLSAFLIPALLLWYSVHSDPVYYAANIWDYNEYLKQFNYLTFFSYIKSFGLLGILFLLGTIHNLRNKMNRLEMFILVSSYISIIGFFLPKFLGIPIPGFRILTVSTYLTMSAVAVYGLIFLTKFTSKRLFYPLIILILIVNSFTIFPMFIKETSKVVEPDFHFTYLPKDLYDGIIFLRNLSPKDALVLANSSAGTDMYIPGLTGKKAFTGHFLMNIKSKEKDENVRKFYYVWDKAEDGYDFLTKNGIKYIVHTKYANNFENNELKKYYPFLKELYRNKLVAIFTY